MDAERHRRAERAARELRRDAGLVEAVAELVQRGEVRDAEVVQVVARRDAHVLRAERLRERVRRRIQAPAVGVEADRLEHGHHGAALVVDLERAGEGAVVARLAVGAGRARDELDELVAQRREQRPQLRGRQPGLEVVEQDVVGVRGGLEARDVAVAQLDVARQGVAEVREVRGRARLLPRLLAERVRVADLRRQRGGHADRLLVVAADGGEQRARRRSRGPRRPPTARARRAAGRSRGR